MYYAIVGPDLTNLDSLSTVKIQLGTIETSKTPKKKGAGSGSPEANSPVKDLRRKDNDLASFVDDDDSC